MTHTRDATFDERSSDRSLVLSFCSFAWRLGDEGDFVIRLDSADHTWNSHDGGVAGLNVNTNEFAVVVNDVRPRDLGAHSFRMSC